jgi:MarR family transcriptional regulator for hemolysin
MKQKEIADEIRVSPSTLSEMIDRLVEDGFVERKPDSEDRRVKRLCLTESGRDRAEYMLKQLTAILERMFINLDTGEKEELIRLLDKLTGFDSRVAGFEKE